MSTGSFEATEPFQHPIGYAVRQDSNDASIINSNADWIAPAARVSSASSCGSGHPRCKVTVNDSDHSYFGMWNESPRVNRNLFWINFTQGSQTLFMDPYTLDYPRQKRNLPRPPVVDGMGSGPDPVGRMCAIPWAERTVRTFVPPFSGDAALYLKLKQPGAKSLLSTGALGAGN